MSSGLVDLGGSFPVEWRKVPFWASYRRVKRVASGAEELLSVYRDHGVIRKADRDDNFNKPSDDLSAYQLVQPGDLVINKMKAWQGSVAVSPLTGIVSPAYFVFESTRANVPRFMHYLLRSDLFVAAYRAGSKGIRPNQWDLDPDVLRGMLVPVPPRELQKQIVDFLDRETAEIDEFIADQEELIVLLTERRSATISHAVTKGLDPTVPMKDSGVEWMGAIPDAWNVRKLGGLAKIGNGATPSRENTEYWRDGMIPWLSSTVVNHGLVHEAAEFVTAAARHECHLPIVAAGSLLVGLTGQGRTRGMVARLAIDSTISQHLAFLTPGQGLDVGYGYWALTSAYGHLRFVSDGNGGTKGGLTCEELSRLLISAPLISEQRAIAAYLDNETAELDGAITDARKAISLSKERRAALISAVVTGKIDVRGMS